MKMVENIYITKVNPIISNESSLIKFYNIENTNSNNSLDTDSFISVIYSNPSYFHINKITLDNEYYIYNELKGNSAIPIIKSPICTDIIDNKAIYGFLSEKFLINLDNEERWRREKCPFSLEEVKSILYKLTVILENAESKGIYHGPITLYNILRTYSMDIKLVGWSQEHQFRDHQVKLVWTSEQSPGFWNFVCNSFRSEDEVRNEYYDKNVFKRDIYSLGRVVLKLLNKNENKWEKELSEKAKDDAIINILKKILDQNVNERYSFIELKKELERNKYDTIEIRKEVNRNSFNFIKKVAKQKNGINIQEEFN